jgi:hypothetical protein
MAYLLANQTLITTMKKIFRVVPLSIFLFYQGCSTEQLTSSSVSKLVNDYSLKQTTVIPAGVTPITFNSASEAKAFLEQRKAVVQARLLTRTAISLPPFQSPQNLSCTTPLNGIYLQTVTDGLFDSITFTSYTNYTYCQGTFLGVSNISSTMTGATLGASYSQSSYNANFTATTISYVIYGVINYYLIVEGGINIWSEDVSMAGSFTNSVIGTSGGGGGPISPPKKTIVIQ